MRESNQPGMSFATNRINQLNGWPNTEELQERLTRKIHKMMAEAANGLLPSPTSSGKSYNPSTTRWKTMPEVTGGKPVIHLHKTKGSRDDAMKKSESTGVEATELLSREDACGMAAGDFDGEVDTPTGEPVSAWIDDQAQNRNNTLGQLHTFLEEYNDGKLPCSPCRSVEQWRDVPYDSNDDVTYDVVHATHNFSHVPVLTDETNIFFDEQPDFKSTVGDLRNEDMTRSRFQDIITAWLKQIDAPVKTWEMFVAIASNNGSTELENTISDPPPVDSDWFITGEDAHSLAPALTEAAYDAFSSDSDANGRRVGKATSDSGAFGDNEDRDPRYSRTRITLIVDDENKPTAYWNVPELGNARSIICLDAWPSEQEWKQNIGDNIDIHEIVNPSEFEKWRRHERGLQVVQIGDGVRPGATEFAVENYTNADQQEVVIESIRDQYGTNFQSAIFPKKMSDQIEQFLPDDFKTMTYGKVKSNNAFAFETVGLVSNSIDPGDDYVLDLLAARGFDASPEMHDCIGCDDDDPDCPVCKGEPQRKQGRKFVGPDADVAADILAGVRENSVAQAIGRWSRKPEAPMAVVFVRTSAIPDGLVDLKIDTPWMFSDKQKAVVDYVRANAGCSVKEIVDETDVSDSSVRRTVDRLVELGVAQAGELRGENRYILTGFVPEEGHLDLSGI